MTIESPMHFAARSKGGAVRLHEADNVLVALNSLERGEVIHDYEIRAAAEIPRGHKTAARPIQSGEKIIKYGQIIGVAAEDIAPGEHVHTHNVSMFNFDRDCAPGARARATEIAPENERATFQGYKRTDGRFGTRNYVGIITSVNCSATVARLIAREAERRGMADKYPNVDGVVPIVHGAGCCIGTNDEAFYKLQRAVWGHVVHPNFAAVLMIGLGCEANQIPLLLEKYGTPAGHFRHFNIQQQGGTSKTVEAGLQWLEDALAYADSQKRETAPASELTAALQCGGSDGLSGITANPALGRAVDMLVRHGGGAALAETPEIYGAEHLLIGRAVSAEVGNKISDLIKWWDDYADRHGGEMNNNPTPGNKAGGLTTILEKSLGAVAKAGTTNLAGVYGYGERITARGLVFVDSPGYDPVSITGQVASGCNLVCFTTGRGSCYGNKPSPTIKIASNTPMFERMRGDMDINCGTVADGAETVAQAGERIFQKMLTVASGERTLSEQLGAGDTEFVPWQTYAQM